MPVEPEDLDLYEEFLTLNRGSKVRIRVPQRGGKRELLETAMLNARESFQRHKLRRASDHNARARTLVALQEALDLPEAPLRIECFDISHIQGTDIVASMVVMEDGIAKRSDYRRFKVKTLDNQDDFASMEEVLTRRFRNYLRERDEGAHAGKRFAYPPNLLVVDGGKGQLNVAVRVLEELGLEDICVASLAKTLRGGVPARAERAGAHPARLRGALPAAAGARRGAPLRDHVSPPAAGQEDDRVGDRRRRRSRARAASSGCCKRSDRSRSCGSWPRRTCSRSRGCPTPVGTAVYRRLHGLDAPDRPAVGPRSRRDDGRRHDQHRAADRRRRSTSRSSPACRARAAPRPRTCSKTSASS